MSEQPKGKYPIGTFVEDRSDEEIGFVTGHTDGTNVLAWLTDLDGGAWEWDLFGPDEEDHRFRPLDNPKEEVAGRFEGFIDAIVAEKLTHVFVWIWMEDDGVPNVNVYKDISDLTTYVPNIGAEDAMRAVSEPGEAIEIDNGEKQQWLRFVLKG